ncbi:MAG: permease-like cell division protein FtsX [bacterium]|nr:permease-like cell division protein FtsX [bacterium]
MKGCRTFFRSFRDAFKSVIRNFSLSLASVTCITITLIIIASALLISDNVSNFTREIERDVTIVAFLNSDVTNEVRDNFELSLKKNSNIENFTFKSKAEVKKDMQKESETFNAVLDEWDDAENPLKDTYTIKVHDVNKIGATAKEIESSDGVNSVQYGEGLVEKLVGVFSAIEKITIFAAGALIIVTIFLIINTIKLTIFSRKREIGIMRLVGASNSRIKLPFVIEGIILGIIGSVIPILAIVFGYTALYDHFGGVLFSSVIRLVKPMPFVVDTSLVVLLIGMIVGMIGSARAVRRYIKV